MLELELGRLTVASSDMVDLTKPEGLNGCVCACVFIITSGGISYTIIIYSVRILGTSLICSIHLFFFLNNDNNNNNNNSNSTGRIRECGYICGMLERTFLGFELWKELRGFK